jgi:hypothetical protein
VANVVNITTNNGKMNDWRVKAAKKDSKLTGTKSN